MSQAQMLPCLCCGNTRLVLCASVCRTFFRGFPFSISGMARYQFVTRDQLLENFQKH